MPVLIRAERASGRLIDFVSSYDYSSAYDDDNDTYYNLEQSTTTTALLNTTSINLISQTSNALR